mmetsp:Transcript_61703/g.159175  ORF Transcript_61703/g.159175 Transcript_61703/m.159175 type:complete len:208 (-) Transcript_61703:84-707(-)
MAAMMEHISGFHNMFQRMRVTSRGPGRPDGDVSVSLFTRRCCAKPISSNTMLALWNTTYCSTTFAANCVMPPSGKKVCTTGIPITMSLEAVTWKLKMPAAMRRLWRGLCFRMRKLATHATRCTTALPAEVLSRQGGYRSLNSAVTTDLNTSNGRPTRPARKATLSLSVKMPRRNAENPSVSAAPSFKMRIRMLARSVAIVARSRAPL